MKHTHRYTATPITGWNVMGFEVLFGWRVECETCHAKPSSGDIVEEIKPSWYKEIKPASEIVRLVYP